MAEQKETYEGFVDLGMNVDDVQEAKPVQAAAYDLTIVSAKAQFNTDENGQKALTKIQCQIEFDGLPNAATMFHTISLPLPDDEPKKKNFKAVLIKKFYKLFNVPISGSGINTSDLVGAKARQAYVELSQYDKGDGSPVVDSNRINLNSVKL